MLLDIVREKIKNSPIVWVQVQRVLKGKDPKSIILIHTSSEVFFLYSDIHTFPEWLANIPHRRMIGADLSVKEFKVVERKCRVYPEYSEIEMN